jgi:hypothetical protein
VLAQLVIDVVDEAVATVVGDVVTLANMVKEIWVVVWAVVWL